MTSVPFPCQPGDKLRVIANEPYGTMLVVGDLVTVIAAGIYVEGGTPLPVVRVSTAHGPQTLGFDVVEPFTPPAYTPAETDDVVDEFLLNIVAADPELEALFVQMDADFAAIEAAEGMTASAEEEEEAHPTQLRLVGRPYTVTDVDGDELEVSFIEKQCSAHGRDGGFHFTINQDEAVIIPVDRIDGLIRYLFGMRKHFEQQEE
jgi:hypothetical protein